MRSKIYLIFFIIITISSGIIYFKYNNFKNFENKKFSGEISIEKGDNIKKVQNKLCEKDIIKDCFSLKLYTYFNKQNDIKVGTYVFSGETINQILKQFKKGSKKKYVKFTILPGWTKFDIKKQLQAESKKLKVNNDTSKIIVNNFLNLVDNKKFILELQNKYPSLQKFGNISSLEGFLYPDTYFFKKSDLNSQLFPQLLIKTAIKNFVKKTKSITWQNKYNLSSYEVLILASIVEKEEKNINNKAMVANILIKRYKKNWFLGADWTLCYGLKVNSKDCKNYLYNKYLKDKTNQYNTRAVLGLPPTPVGNPTINAIKSVINSKENPYWYYLHDKNGQIHYGKNANEHNFNKNKYLK